MAPLSYTAGLILKSEDALAAPLVQGIALPLPLLLSESCLAALAPDWLRFPEARSTP